MKKVLGIGGSPRKGGNSDILMKHLLRGARDGGASTEEIQLRDYQFQPCIGCERCRKDEKCTGLHDGMQLIYPKIEDAMGLVLICPVYSYNMTALMKSFIDRLYSFYYFSDERPGYWSSRLGNQGRKAIISFVGEQSTLEEGGMNLSFETMRRSVEALGHEIIGEMPVPGIFHKGRVKEYSQILNQAENLGREFASRL
ncbi:flavodoxin family protein [Chloroflexota bacterium]